MNTFFNRNEFKYALDLLRKDPWNSVKKLDDYFEKYPYDYSSYPYYISALITIREIDKAEEVLNRLDEMVQSDTRYKKRDKYQSFFKKNIFFARLKLYLYQERYIDAYNLFISNPDCHFEESNTIFLYCKTKLGLVKDDDKIATYIFRQIIEYSEDAFLEHIKRHDALHNEALENKNGAIFAKDFPFQELLPKIKEALLNDTSHRLYTGYYDNSFIFRYDNCGTVDNKMVNFFKVVCFHNTCNIITMYPEEGSSIPYIDFTMINYEKEKTKRISQIAKFRQRYQRKEQ